jgi:hypothetical protein
MRATIAALVAGEASLLAGLWFAWWPLALIAGGSQLVAAALFIEHPDPKAGGES